MQMWTVLLTSYRFLLFPSARCSNHRVAPDSACSMVPPFVEKCIWYHYALKMEIGNDTQNTCTILCSCIGFEALMETEIKCSQMIIV
jgi:hypothetical protein